MLLECSMHEHGSSHVPGVDTSQTLFFPAICCHPRPVIPPSFNVPVLQMLTIEKNMVTLLAMLSVRWRFLQDFLPSKEKNCTHMLRARMTLSST